VTSDKQAEELYALARGHFWLERYLLAASRFGQLASRLQRPEERARSLFQQGRSYELNGNWDLAANSFRLAYTTDSNGNWSGPSLFAALRLEWRMNQEGTALELYELLSTQRGWLDAFGRSALFLAASDIVRGRSDRAAGWLEDARRRRETSALEIDYWRGRLAELTGQDSRAIGHYVSAYTADPFDPVARAAVARLTSAALAAPADARARELAASNGTSDLTAGWLLLGDDDPAGLQARQRLERRLRSNPETGPFFAPIPAPPVGWPLWQGALRRPEEMLLALGVWNESAGTVLRYFPVSDVPLGVTASMLLARAGEHRSSLYIAEILEKRIPGSLPAGLLPREMRHLLYPFPHREQIRAESRRRGIDPNLLAAVIREESRFDPWAVSTASARGLTQFVLPTARRLAGRIGLENLEVADLHQPSISIALGAGYLAELLERFDGETHTAVAAYNAGENQAQLWRSYCYSREPAEYLSKVSFTQTRTYLAKVLRSRNEYAALWGNEAD
jgi:soluble lytic murein transglycosylase